MTDTPPKPHLKLFTGEDAVKENAPAATPPVPPAHFKFQRPDPDKQRGTVRLRIQIGQDFQDLQLQLLSQKTQKKDGFTQTEALEAIDNLEHIVGLVERRNIRESREDEELAQRLNDLGKFAESLPEKSQLGLLLTTFETSLESYLALKHDYGLSGQGQKPRR